MLTASIIGTGRIASALEKDPLRPPGSSHAGQYAQQPEIDLIAGCDTNPETLSAFAQDWNIPQQNRFSDYPAML